MHACLIPMYDRTGVLHQSLGKKGWEGAAAIVQTLKGHVTFMLAWS